jgi:hypothetical protein
MWGLLNDRKGRFVNVADSVSVAERSKPIGRRMDVQLAGNRKPVTSSELRRGGSHWLHLRCSGLSEMGDLASSSICGAIDHAPGHSHQLYIFICYTLLPELCTHFKKRYADCFDIAYSKPIWHVESVLQSDYGTGSSEGENDYSSHFKVKTSPPLLSLRTIFQLYVRSLTASVV